MKRYIPIDIPADARRRFNAHRARAKRRGILFMFTFQEWWGIWARSGHWHERGPRRGQYVMSRYADAGIYEIDNVRICLAEENAAERRYSKETRARMRAAKLGRKFAAVSAALLGNQNSLGNKSNQGRKFTDVHRGQSRCRTARTI